MRKLLGFVLGIGLGLTTISFAQIYGGGGAGNTGTITSIATTSPIAGGTITSTGTISCPTCVVGPASVTTAHLAVFNGTTGKLIADGGAVPTGTIGGSIASGQVAVGSGVNTIIGDANFKWDGNLKIGIGDIVQGNGLTNTTTTEVDQGVDHNIAWYLNGIYNTAFFIDSVNHLGYWDLASPDTHGDFELFQAGADASGADLPMTALATTAIAYGGDLNLIGYGGSVKLATGGQGFTNVRLTIGDALATFAVAVQAAGYKSSDGSAGATTTGFKNGLYVSAPGPAFVGILRGVTGSIGGGALAAGQCATGNATVAGATTAMSASASPVADPDPSLSTGVVWDAFVSSSNTVTVRVCGLVIVTPNATSYQVTVVP